MVTKYPFVLICLIFSLYNCKTNKTSNTIHTVRGVINTSELGRSLTHEHIMSNFGKDLETTSDYDSIKLMEQVIPYLKYVKSYGVNSIFDCTTAYFGRRVDLLKTISDVSGIQIITNTGFYGAANDKYIPKIAYNSSAKAISNIWVDEFENGINGTGIKPGFIKLAFDSKYPVSDIDKKLFEAGVISHLKTGLTLAVHTGNNIKAATLQKTLLENYNVSLSAWIWTHADKVKDIELLINYAAKGAWISLDGVKASNINDYITKLNYFKKNNLLHKILLSHDGNGFPKGGEIRPFDAIYKSLVPSMLENGFSNDDINQILIKNPKAAFNIGIRKIN